jgi:endonuclease YncB( thermonuclease family)
VVLLLLAACQPVTQTGPNSDGAETAVVAWIYDGDTIEVEQSGILRDVRLMGINAPEEGECYYEEALRFLIETTKGHEVELRVVDTDQFDRSLAYVTLGEKQVNLELVDGGFAIATTPAATDAAGIDLLEAEERARTGNVGLWSSTACGAMGEPPDLTLAVNQFDEFATVTNSGSSTVDLTSWILRDESSRHRYSFAPGTSLDPGDAIEVGSADNGWDPGRSNVWNNGGDMAMLLDADGRVIAATRYP